MEDQNENINIKWKIEPKRFQSLCLCAQGVVCILFSCHTHFSLLISKCWIYAFLGSLHFNQLLRLLFFWSANLVHVASLSTTKSCPNNSGTFDDKLLEYQNHTFNILIIFIPIICLQGMFYPSVGCRFVEIFLDCSWYISTLLLPTLILIFSFFKGCFLWYHNYLFG